MSQANTDFGRVSDDLRRAAGSFALLTSSATLFGASLSRFREFERQLIATNAIAGGTVQQFRAMSEAATLFSVSTTIAATDAAAALQQLAQAGFTAEESLSSLSGVLLLAQATFTDVGITADIMTSNIRAFGLEASEASRVSNTLAAATTTSLATMDKLAFAFRQVAPVARLANLSIEETTALLNQLFNVGLRGEQAGTALRNIIIRLVRPLGEAQKILREYGIATRNAAGDLLPLVDIFRQLREEGVTTAELSRIFETEALAGVVILLNATAVAVGEVQSEYEKNLEAITDTDKALELAAINLRSFDGQMKRFGNTIEAVQRDLGERLAPAILVFVDGITAMIEAFRNLEPATQNFILFLTSAAVGLGILLATINVFVLLFGGAAFKAITGFAKALWTSSAAAAATGKSLGLLQRAGNFIVSSFAKAARGIASFTFVLASATPYGRFARLASSLIVTLGGIAFAWLGITKAANAAETAQFNALTAPYQEAALTLADRFVDEKEIEDLDQRIADLSESLDLAEKIQGDFDNIGTGARGVIRGGELGAQLTGILDEYRSANSEVAEALAAEREIRGQFDRLLAVRLENANWFDRGFARAANRNMLSNAIDNFYETLTPEVLAGLEVARSRETLLLQSIARGTEVVADARILRDVNTREFLEAIIDPDSDALSGDLAILEERIAGYLRDDSVFTAVANMIRFIGKDVSQLDVIVETLREAGVDPTEISQFLLSQQALDISAVSRAFEGANSVFDTQMRDLRIRILEQEVRKATSLAEAIDLARQASLMQLEADLEDMADEIESTITDSLEGFVFSNAQGYAAAIDSVFDGTDYERFGETNPSFAQVVSGQFMIDAINEQINESTTVEQAQAIIDAEFIKYQQIMTDYLNALVEASIIKEDDAQTVYESAFASAALVGAQLIAGLNDASAGVEAATKAATGRFRTRPGRQGGGGGGGDPVKKALREARRLEDAFYDAEKGILKARQTFVENAEGLSVDIRIEAGFELDVERINQDADAQIRRLDRKLKDLELDGVGGQQLDELRVKYAELTMEIDRARDAEIAAASSFQAQMERRSDALDLLIRDLETLAFISTNTFDKVTAGIGKAFAEYQRDLVTLVDITADAVGSFLDTLTTGIADFIFDNENAWENFKASMLDISRQIFEGFTKGLIQQTISSVTGGGGSIFGNQTQPGAGGDEGGQGIGSFFQNLLGGLGLGGGGGTPGAPGGDDGGVTAGITAVTTALQTGAGQIQAAFAALGPQIQGSGGLVTAGLTTTGAGITTSGTVASTAVSTAGTGLAGAINATTSQVAVSGSKGLFGGFFKNLFGGGFAEGGRIAGAGSGTSDSILAAVSDGEFIVNANMTKEFLPLLEAINSGALKGDTASAVLLAMRDKNGGYGSIPKFAFGGLIDAGSFGPPAINLTEPRIVSINNNAAAMGASSITNNNQKGGNTLITLRIVQNISGTQSNGEARRSADQLAKRLANQIERSKKNT